MTTVTSLLQRARVDVGFVEGPRNNETPFGAWLGYNFQPWCASWVSKVFFDAGLAIPAKTVKGFAYCPDGVNYFKRIRRWYSTPEVGDVVFYKFDNDALADHVGIVESINHDGSIVAIEGNTNNAGSANGDRVMRRTRYRSQILGFGRPAYERERGNPVPPPSKILSTTQTEDDMKTIDFVTGKFDDQGNGWHLLDGTNGLPDVPFEKFRGATCSGSAPVRDGYWAVPTIGFNNTNGKTLLTFRGGRSKETHTIRLLVAE